MIGARSAAMAFNRLVDWQFDAANPRTQNRALPQGLVSQSYVIAFIFGASMLFVFAAYHLNNLSFLLAPIALAIVFFYSYTKRFTALSHLFLGLALACAPIGAWIAIRGDLTAIPLMLGLAVGLWVAGFDVIYACQDVDFDRKTGLYSLPQRFGIRQALITSALMHVGTILLLVWIMHGCGLGWLSYVGVLIVAALLVYEHSIVKPDDLSRVNTAFFTINGFISILLFVITTIDVLFK
jgi:4-hydroxybenzoate polyprenyltransferase